MFILITIYFDISLQSHSEKSKEAINKKKSSLKMQYVGMAFLAYTKSNSCIFHVYRKQLLFLQLDQFTTIW